MIIFRKVFKSNKILKTILGKRVCLAKLPYVLVCMKGQYGCSGTRGKTSEKQKHQKFSNSVFGQSAELQKISYRIILSFLGSDGLSGVDKLVIHCLGMPSGYQIIVSYQMQAGEHFNNNRLALKISMVQ